MLSTIYPSPKALISTESKTLNFLKNNKYMSENHDRLQRQSGIAYDQIIYAHLQSLIFGSFLDLRHDKKDLRLFIEALVETESSNISRYSQITYSLTICRLRKRSHGLRLSILRKYHFDVALPSPTSTQEHPLFHLQYCGKLSPFLIREGLTSNKIECLHPRLSEPRLFFWPVSLALLIDAVLHEFPDYDSRKFRQTTEWKNIVMNNENLLLRPFYEKCTSISSGLNSNFKILADAFDVK